MINRAWIIVHPPPGGVVKITDLGIGSGEAVIGKSAYLNMS